LNFADGFVGVRKERAQISVDPTTGSKGFSITPEGVKGPSETWDGWLCKLVSIYFCLGCLSLRNQPADFIYTGCPVNAEAGQFYPNLHFLSKSVQEPAVPAGCDKINLQAVPRTSA
jgi:hypothetical protein